MAKLGRKIAALLLTILSALSFAIFLAALVMLGITSAAATNEPPERKEGQLRIALLHLAVHYADLDKNEQLLTSAIRLAAANGADWIVTPELALTGYRFDLKLGSDWIKPGTDPWRQRLQLLADELNITLFLGHLQQDPKNQKRYNTLFVIGADGKPLGQHRKINTIAASEGWSSPGPDAKLVEIDGIKVGMLICADAWPSEHAESLANQGAELLISSANWTPGEYGPGNTWKKRANETGLPLFVANRTGQERGIDMTESSSVLAVGGQHEIDHRSAESTIVLIDWSLKKKVLLAWQAIPVVGKN